MFNFLNRDADKNEIGSKGKIIALLNQKGGVGKTTMAYNLAFALKAKKHKVLCIDMDPQANFSSLFFKDQNFISSDKSIHQLLINSIRELRSVHTDVMLSEAIVKTDSGIDLIASGQALSGFELSVAGINAPRQLILKKFIEKNNLNEIYDYIIIDGPPTLGLIVVNILCAADGLLFPFIPDAFSEQGLKNIQTVIEDIEDMGIVQTPRVLGYIPNLFEKRRRQAQDDFSSINQQFKDAFVFEPFSNKANFAKSIAHKKSVFDYQAKDFQELQEQFFRMSDIIENQLRS